MKKKKVIADKQTKFLLYSNENEKVKVEVFLEDETVWLTQKGIAELFGVVKSTISEHLTNIYESSELEKDSTVRNFRTVQQEGERMVSRELEYYNLDAIISVGYRVNSKQATKFRIWATNTLKEFIVKGFVLDDERLKNGEYFGKNYFRELLERVRSIRASERQIYQQITDIFAECSIDYDPKSKTTNQFYATIQNKFHFAITGKTAAEIIYDSADSQKEFMGLTTWKNSPDGRILKSDATIAKNYLSESEIKKLERTIGSFFDYIERIIETQNTFTMEEFSISVNNFLKFNHYEVLKDKGTVSAIEAEEKAAIEYEKFNRNRVFESDFDKAIKSLKENN